MNRVLVLREEGRFLAMHKAGQKSPFWELPGGRMQFGETIEEALVREMLEEAGLSVSPTILLTTWKYMKKTSDFQVSGVIYQVTIEDLSLLRCSEEHDAYTWLSFDELDKLVPHFATSLSRIAELS